MNDRQEAERFAALLDAHAAGGREGAQAGSGAGAGALVALAERVGAAGRELPGPDADFRDALRARLVAEAPALVAQPASESSRARGKVPAQRAGRGSRTGARHSGESRPRVFTGISAAWRRRLLAAGVGVAVATGSVGGIAVASAGAQPGDPLYNAKRIFESLQLSLSGSPTDQGREYLHLADIRLGEIDTLLSRPDVDMNGSPTQAYLEQVLGELRTMIGDGGNLLIGQVRADGDQTALHALADFLLTERQRVADLSWRLPPSMQSQPPRIVALMDQLGRQLQQAAQAAAARQSGQQGSDTGEQGGGGQQGRSGGSQGTQTGAAGPTASSSATPGASVSASGSASATGPSASGSASPGGPATPGATIGISVPVPGVPSIGVTLPGLLGLPGIDLGLGGDEDGSGASPTK